MKGRIGQRDYYAALPSALTERWTSGPGDRSTISQTSMHTAATTPTRSSSRWGPSPTPPGLWSMFFAVKVGRSAPWVTELPTVPGCTTFPMCSAARAVASSSGPTTRPLPTTR